ncbi:transcription factor HBI1 isoform X3 [Capsicum annuum]|uniref:transcription factor HBI1 isoform X3 n=1 Tax=Capsicum annuum TaxID=4072 RepID=UPI001FB147E0|nr:transcription factor HBI1 isoform X3 [Capsicum annuum]
MEFSQFQNFPMSIDTQMDFGREQRNLVGFDLAINSFSKLSNSSITRTLSKKRKSEFYEEDECKAKKRKGEAGEVKSKMTMKSEKGKSSKGNLEAKKTNYIHVRAHRGQVIDSHGLAERVTSSSCEISY